VTFEERVARIPHLVKLLDDITIESVISQFPAVNRTAKPLELSEKDAAYLLTCGSILAQSEVAQCQAIALRIAQFFIQSSSASENQKAAGCVILDTLTLRPAVELAKNLGQVPRDFWEQLPLPLQLDAMQREAKFGANWVNQDILLNKLQFRLLETIRNSDFVSFSAPTSAGKSFVLNHYILEFLQGRSQHTTIVCLVPTRALIDEFESKLQGHVKLLVEKPIVTSLPQLPEGWREKSCIFVFTQERLQWLMNEEKNFSANLLIIDEAQKVGDGPRGILLQQVIEDLIGQSPKIRVIFSSPMAQNPEIFERAAPAKASPQSLSADQVTVNQNQIWVTEHPDDSSVRSIGLILRDSVVPLGLTRLPFRPTDEKKKMAFVVHALGDNRGGNLVYANGPAEAEDVGGLLADLVGVPEPDEELQELIRLVKKVIHPKFVLAKLLQHGVACHYGNMPLIVRSEIERLFRAAKIKYLVCTSTLMEGVNLPAKSIFVRGPERGQHKPMTDIDFWNLGGRAGRLGQEFQGNIICVDPLEERVWPKPPPKHRVKYKIERALDIVAASGGQLLNYVGSGTPRADSRKTPELEYGFVYFFNKFKQAGTLLSEELSSKHPPEFLKSLELHCQRLAQEITIPAEIIRRNPGISPVAQQALLSYFIERAKSPKKQLAELIPALPEATDAVSKSYTPLIVRIGKYLSGDPRQLAPFYAVLVVNWMRGYPLPRIIESSLNYWKDRKTEAAIIREAMRHVEEYARFKFVKYVACYTDVLRFYFLQQRRDDLAERLPKLNIYLEFGASQMTQVSLMGLGLSRQTAIELSSKIASDALGTQACAKWIKKCDLGSLDISRAMIEEIRRLKAIL
jgi:hypothetical protein